MILPFSISSFAILRMQCDPAAEGASLLSFLTFTVDLSSPGLHLFTFFSVHTHSLHCYFFSTLTTACQPFFLIFVLLSSFSHEDSNSQACLCPSLKLQHVFLIRIPVIIQYLQHLIILFPLSPNWFKDYLPNYLA